MQIHTHEKNTSFIAIGTLIILLNSLEIYFIINRRRKIKPYEYLILNLAIADFLIGGVQFVGAIYAAVQHSWVQDEIMHWLVVGIGLFSIYSSGMNILVISIDRLTAIKFPLRHKVWMSKRNAKIVSAITWIMTMTYAGIHASLDYRYGKRWFMNSIIATLVFSFGAAMVITHILLIHHILKKPDTEAETRLRQKKSWEKKVILNCTLFVGTYIICTWPWAVSLLKRDDFSARFETQTLFFINSLIDPCLYFFKDYLRRNHKRRWRGNNLPLIDEEIRR